MANPYMWQMPTTQKNQKVVRMSNGLLAYETSGGLVPIGETLSRDYSQLMVNPTAPQVFAPRVAEPTLTPTAVPQKPVISPPVIPSRQIAPQTLPEDISQGIPQSTTPQQTENPLTKFNLALMEMLREAQKGNVSEDLYKQQSALQRASIERQAEVTPEELRVLSPQQQEAIRSGKAQALEPEIDAISAKIKSQNQNLVNFENLLQTARGFGESISKTIKASPEIIAGYKEMIELGGSPTAIPDEIRNDVIAKVDWNKWKVATTKPSGGVGGGITDLQGFDRELKIANDFEKYAKDSRAAVMGIQTIRTGFDEAVRALKENKPLNAQSQAVIIGFNKMLDPTSVVRESEYARTPEGASLLNRIEGFKIRVFQGGAGLNKSELEGIKDTAVALLRGYQQSQLNFSKRTQQQALQLQEMSGGRYGNLERILTPDVLDLLNKTEGGGLINEVDDDIRQLAEQYHYNFGREKLISDLSSSYPEIDKNEITNKVYQITKELWGS